MRRMSGIGSFVSSLRVDLQELRLMVGPPIGLPVVGRGESAGRDEGYRRDGSF
jgi:hypothetical protein